MVFGGFFDVHFVEVSVVIYGFVDSVGGVDDERM